MSIIRNKNIAARLAGGAVAAGLILGAPALATLVAAPASADSPSILIQDGNGGGIGVSEDFVIFGNGQGDGAIITDDGFGASVGGVEFGFED